MQTECEPKTEKNGRELNRRKKIILAGVAFLLLIALAVGGWLYVDSLAYKLCRVEAGVLVAPSDFLKKQRTLFSRRTASRFPSRSRGDIR